MSDEKSLALVRMFTKEDAGVIRAEVVDLRSKGDDRSAEEIAAGLRSTYPGIDDKFIKMVEASPGYVSQVIDTQKGKMAAAIPDVIDAIIGMARSGSIKHIEKLLELSGLGNGRVPPVQNNTQNNLNLKVEQGDDFLGRFLGTARAVGAYPDSSEES